jgi:hypothetical protein
MKTNMTRTLILTAVALTSAAAVYAEDKVIAKVPFAFRTYGGQLAAGKYSITMKNNNAVVVLQNQKTGSSVAGIAMPGTESRDHRSRLEFRCGDQSGCALAAVWLSDGRVYSLNVPRITASELERIAVVYVGVTKAD